MRIDYKLNGQIRSNYQSEPTSREFLRMGEYAVGDDGCVYQFVDKDDATSFLIYDCVEQSDMAFNYAEDQNRYELIEEGEFDKIFSGEVEGFEISDFYKDGNVRIKEVSFYERTLYRVYFDNQPEGYPISEDVWDNVDVSDYDIFNEEE